MENQLRGQEVAKHTLEVHSNNLKSRQLYNHKSDTHSGHTRTHHRPQRARNKNGIPDFSNALAAPSITYAGSDPLYCKNLSLSEKHQSLRAVTSTPNCCSSLDTVRLP